MFLLIITVYISGPTICPYAMEHVEAPAVTATNAVTTGATPTPTLFEVSPNAYDEQIVEITVTNLPENETPKILTPNTELDTVTVSAFHD